MRYDTATCHVVRQVDVTSNHTLHFSAQVSLVHYYKTSEGIEHKNLQSKLLSDDFNDVRHLWILSNKCSLAAGVHSSN